MYLKRLGDVTIFQQVGFIDNFKAFFRYFRHGIHLAEAELQHQGAVCGDKIASTVSRQLSWSYFKEIICLGNDKETLLTITCQ